jgi:hypothetical protein
MSNKDCDLFSCVQPHFRAPLPTNGKEKLLKMTTATQLYNYPAQLSIVAPLLPTDT